MNEIGRELKASELKLKTIVVIRREDRPGMAVTGWVRELGQDFVIFYSGAIKTKLLTYLREDGELVDDTGKRIIVNEYLGEV